VRTKLIGDNCRSSHTKSKCKPEPSRQRRRDPLTPTQRSYTMAQVKSEDTRPEMAVRRLMHALGYRYRLHRRDLPGTPDLAFISLKKVVFVHGCFWHGHRCKAGRKRPLTNHDYWQAKLASNRTRDRRARQELVKMGWDALVVWECELRAPTRVSDRIVNFLEDTVT